VRIYSNVFIPEYSYLKKGCWIGPCVTITSVLHPLCKKAKECVKGATIGENTRGKSKYTSKYNYRKELSC
jgi:UDP-3-O-[3-hydroxymyristoyl] glucosamine N-acyltransferase